MKNSGSIGIGWSLLTPLEILIAVSNFEIITSRLGIKLRVFMRLWLNSVIM